MSALFKQLRFKPFWIVMLLVAVSCSPLPNATDPGPDAQIIVEDFEADTKGSYAAGSVSLGSGSWVLDGALLGSTANDKKRGVRAARLQGEGTLTMDFDIPIRRVRVLHAIYGSDSPSDWELWASSNRGRTWAKIGNTISSTSLALEQAVFEVNATTNVRLQIRKTSGGNNRINIDDFAFEILPVPPGNITTPTRDYHLLFGNPSGATPNQANPDNFLIEHSQFIVSYNNQKGIANWVAWHLSSAWKGNAPRQNNFSPDPSLPQGFKRVVSGDYTNTGFDRGHLCPSDDRDASVEDNSATFLMTNIVPQAPVNNQQTWRFLEEYCRKLAAENHEMYIMAGGYDEGGAGSQGGVTRNIANGKVSVPARLWKIILILPNGSDDLRRITPTTRIIAVDMPNTQNVNSRPWGDYRVSVDHIEAATGFNFFSNIPRGLQDVLEARVDNGPVQ
jgi:endonuclease G